MGHRHDGDARVDRPQKVLHAKAPIEVRVALGRVLRPTIVHARAREDGDHALGVHDALGV